ncbi:MAG TPA: CvpA family protein [Candidatus Avidesulfovibrio excrementigallinarum]|nr:CvpA family protein [Candidatus Avidesulfovibrio excrementigallinarum]
MTLPFGLNYLDGALLLILLIMAGRGGLRGFLAEIAGLIGLVGGVVLAGRYYPELANRLTSALGQEAAWIPVVSYVVILFGFMLGIGLIARLLHRILTVACADAVNHMLGVGAGFLKGLAICCVVVYAVRLLVPSSDLVRTSVMVGFIEQVMSLIGTYLPQTGLDKYLPSGLEIPNL